MTTISTKEATDARRVLIYRLGNLGDTLIALPAPGGSGFS
jgi:hypothetical protein